MPSKASKLPNWQEHPQKPLQKPENYHQKNLKKRDYHLSPFSLLCFLELKLKSNKISLPQKVDPVAQSSNGHEADPASNKARKRPSGTLKDAPSDEGVDQVLLEEGHLRELILKQQFKEFSIETEHECYDKISLQNRSKLARFGAYMLILQLTRIWGRIPRWSSGSCA